MQHDTNAISRQPVTSRRRLLCLFLYEATVPCATLINDLSEQRPSTLSGISFSRTRVCSRQTLSQLNNPSGVGVNRENKIRLDYIARYYRYSIVFIQIVKGR